MKAGEKAQNPGAPGLSTTSSPEDCLRRALASSDPAARARWARKGLALDSEDLDPDTQVLLLRQIYLSHLTGRRLRKAADVATQMVQIGSMADIAHHDAARAFQALGEWEQAIAEQRLALRAAPPARRAFHAWCLGTVQHFAGDIEGALASLKKAERWATRDKSLMRAHSAYVRLSSGTASPNLARVVADLEKSPLRESYGRFLLGMIAYEMGDHRRAVVHLRAWLRRHASADVAQTLTLREELRRARSVVATLAS